MTKAKQKHKKPSDHLHPMTLRIPPDLWSRMLVKAAGVPINRWIRRLIEREIGGGRGRDSEADPQ